MIRTDQKGKWQLAAVTVNRFKTKKDMDEFAYKNAIRIVAVTEFKKGIGYCRDVIDFGKVISLDIIKD